MVSEVSDCTSVGFESTPYESFNPVIPQGLAAISDSIQMPPEAPKPNFLKRIALDITLLLVHLTTWTVQFCNWVLKHIFGLSSRQKLLYSQLYHIAKKGEVNEVREFLNRHAKEDSAAGFLFGEFLALPELFIHLPEILKGANVCLCQDRGFFCNRWREHPHSYRRLSSHEYLEKECYAVGHLLFWLDPAGNTRFQFEKSPFTGFFGFINHLVDYLRYVRDNEQQGVAGSSPYTEQFCLTLPIDPEAFLLRQLHFLTTD